MPGLRRIIDGALEVPVVTSFTRVGYDVRSRLEHWTEWSAFDLSGRTVLVTGGGRGIGRATALGFAELGADVAIAARDADNLAKTLDDLLSIGPEHSGNHFSVLIQGGRVVFCKP